MNSNGVSWADLLSEERKYHSAQVIITMMAITEELDEVIPELEKEENITEDFTDEIDTKKMMLNGTKMMFMKSVEKGKFNPDKYQLF